MLLALVAASIGLQLVSASLLKYAALPERPALRFVLLALIVIGLLNFGRLLIWNHIHRRFPVSMAYPLSALFFPGILLVAHAMGETLGRMQIVGGVVVTCGVVLILMAEQGETDAPGGTPS